MRRADVDRNVWACLLEDARHRADGYHELPIMWPRLSRWGPWHPAIVAALGIVFVALAVALH